MGMYKTMVYTYKSTESGLQTPAGRSDSKFEAQLYYFYTRTINIIDQRRDASAVLSPAARKESTKQATKHNNILLFLLLILIIIVIIIIRMIRSINIKSYKQTNITPSLPARRASGRAPARPGNTIIIT